MTGRDEQIARELREQGDYLIGTSRQYADEFTRSFVRMMGQICHARAAAYEARKR